MAGRRGRAQQNEPAWNVMNRGQIEALANRAAFRMEIATAGEVGGSFRVTGVMNSFGVMRSRRVLHPQGFVDWLERTPNASVPMLSNHGGWNDARLSTIGQWDRFEYDAKRGMVWSGVVGEGTQLCDDARKLLSQKLISGLSLGWNPTAPPRWVTMKDADLDPFFKEAMERERVDECFAFWDYEPVEGSIVDVADDRLGLLAARAPGQGPGGDDFIAALEMIRADMREVLAEQCKQFANELAEITDQWRAFNGDRILDEGNEYAEALCDDDDERGCTHGARRRSAAAAPLSETSAALIEKWKHRAAGHVAR